MRALLRLALDELRKVEELLAESFLVLAFSFLLLEFVKVVHASAASLHVDVVGCDAGLFVELDVLQLFVGNVEGHLQVEVDDGNQLVLEAGLEERVLDVGERNVDLQPFGRSEAHTVLVDLKVANGLSALDGWFDDNVFEGLFSSLDRNELLSDVLELLLFIFLLIRVLVLLDEFFDLLLRDSEVVLLSLLVLVLKRHLLQENSIGISHIREQQTLAPPWSRNVEVNSQESPLALV